MAKISYEEYQKLRKSDDPEGRATNMAYPWYIVNPKFSALFSDYESFLAGVMAYRLSGGSLKYLSTSHFDGVRWVNYTFTESKDE